MKKCKKCDTIIQTLRAQSEAAKKRREQDKNNGV